MAWKPLIMNMHVSARNPNRKNAHKGGSGPLISDKYSYALETSPHFVVYGPTKSINTPVRFTEKTLEKENCMKETSELFNQETYQKRNYSLADFLVRLSVSLGKEKALKIHEELSSMKLQGLHELTDTKLYSLRTSMDYSTTNKEIPLRLSSESWMRWGMMSNGRCLTARISVSHRIGKECSLSDILEEKVDQKYFLSEKAAKRVTEHWDYKVHDRQQEV